MSARDYLNTHLQGPAAPTRQSVHYRLAIVSVNGAQQANCGGCDMNHRNHCDLGWPVNDQHVCDRWIKRGAGNPKQGRQ